MSLHQLLQPVVPEKPLANPQTGMPGDTPQEYADPTEILAVNSETEMWSRKHLAHDKFKNLQLSDTQHGLNGKLSCSVYW